MATHTNPRRPFFRITLPLLRLAADGEVRSLASARKELAVRLDLTEAQQAELLPSGRQGRFANRVAWAKVYLERAGVFSSEASTYVRTIDPRVALIDGKQLAQFMIDYNIGVSLDRAYEVKKVDSDFFED